MKELILFMLSVLASFLIANAQTYTYDRIEYSELQNGKIKKVCTETSGFIQIDMDKLIIGSESYTIENMHYIAGNVSDFTIHMNNKKFQVFTATDLVIFHPGLSGQIQLVFYNSKRYTP